MHLNSRSLFRQRLFKVEYSYTENRQTSFIRRNCPCQAKPSPCRSSVPRECNENLVVICNLTNDGWYSIYFRLLPSLFRLFCLPFFLFWFWLWLIKIIAWNSVDTFAPLYRVSVTLLGNDCEVYTKKNQSSNLALVNYLNDDVFSKQQGESQVHLPV